MANPVRLSELVPTHKLQSLVQYWLDEDIPSFDVGGAVVALADSGNASTATLFCKESGLLAGVPFFEAVFNALGCRVDWIFPEGAEFTVSHPEKISVAKVTGSARNILAGERTALNCLTRSSGIATQTRKYVQLASECHWSGKIACTRKTTPGFRLVEKYAVLIGGGDCHRNDLSSMTMLKDNHINAVGSMRNAVKLAKSMGSFTTKIEVECGSQKDAMQAANAGADIVMLDNFDPDVSLTRYLFDPVPGVDVLDNNGHIRENQPNEAVSVARQLKTNYSHVLVEVSGGIDIKSIVKFFSNDIDIISVGKLTQGYPAVDFSLKIDKVNS